MREFSMSLLCKIAVCGVASTLVACAGLNNTLKRRIDIAEQCRQVLDGEASSVDRHIPENIVSLRLSQWSNCSLHTLESPGTMEASDFLPMCSLRDLFDKHLLKIDDTALRQSLNELQSAVVTSRIDELFGTAIQDCKTNGKDKTKPLSCLATALTGPREMSARDSVVKAISNTRTALHGLRNELRTLETKTKTDAAKLSNDAKIDMAVWSKNFETYLDKLAQIVSGDFRMIASDAVRNYGVRYSAKRSLDMLHKALRPAEIAVNRADDKTYGAISAGTLVFGDSIQSAVNDSYARLMEGYKKRVNDQSDMLKAFSLELGRAACENLEKRTDLALLTDLVDTMFIDQASKQISPSLLSEFGHSLKDIPPLRPDGILPLIEESQGISQVENKPVPIQPASSKTEACDSEAKISPPIDKDAAAKIYMAHEWSARQLLLKRQFQENVRGRGVSQTEGPVVIEPVDEVEVERLSESAAAVVIDDALRRQPPGNQALSLGPIGSLTLNATMQNIVNVSNSLSATFVLSNVSNFNPSYAPVINLPEVKPSRTIELCSDWPFSEASCFDDQGDHVIVLQKYFSSGHTTNQDIVRLTEMVANQIRRYAVLNNVQFSARVEGFASMRPVRKNEIPTPKQLKSLLPGNVDVLSSDGILNSFKYISEFRNAIELESVTVPVQNDGNVILSAVRAVVVANELEKRGGGRIRVKTIVPYGTSKSAVINGNNDVDSDRSVIIRLSKK